MAESVAVLEARYRAVAGAQGPGAVQCDVLVQRLGLDGLAEQHQWLEPRVQGGCESGALSGLVGEEGAPCGAGAVHPDEHRADFEAGVLCGGYQSVDGGRSAEGDEVPAGLEDGQARAHPLRAPVLVAARVVVGVPAGVGGGAVVVGRDLAEHAAVGGDAVGRVGDDRVDGAGRHCPQVREGVADDDVGFRGVEHGVLLLRPMRGRLRPGGAPVKRRCAARGPNRSLSRLVAATRGSGSGCAAGTLERSAGV